MLFGLPILPDLNGSYLGFAKDPADPNAFFWFLEWWPHALAEGTNPLFSHAVWAPTGINLAPATTVPAASILAWPITAAFGPVVSYNLLMLSAPVAAAWTAFALCRHVTGSFWPAVAGGYLFGFSTYELGHLAAHLNLVMVFLVPLCVLLVLKRIDETIGPRAFLGLLVAALAGQFLFSPEVFATMTAFGVLAVLIGLFVWKGQERERLYETAVLVGLAYVITAVVLSPFLFFFFSHGVEAGSQDPAYVYSVDLANLVIPTNLTAIGGHAFVETSAKFVGNYAETTSYLGLPLVAVVVAFAVKARRSAGGKLLCSMLSLVMVAALGPSLMVAGKEVMPLPWALVGKLPLIQLALPIRFMMYAFLIVGLMCALWLSSIRTRGGRILAWGLVVAAVAMLAPRVGSEYWQGKTHLPPFFAQGTYRTFLERNQNVLALPYGRLGADAMLWQADTDMWFRLAGGYVSCEVPEEFRGWPLLQTLLYGTPSAEAGEQLKTFLGAHDIRTVVVAQAHADTYEGMLSTLGVTPVGVGGVVLYEVPPEVLTTYATAKPSAPAEISNCG